VKSQRYTWRLAYQKVGGAWHYAKVSGDSISEDSVKNYDQVSFGSIGSFRIRIEFDNLSVFYGIGTTNDATTVTINNSQLPPKVFPLGDSWVWRHLIAIRKLFGPSFSYVLLPLVR
jgi:hypothetical protein